MTNFVFKSKGTSDLQKIESKLLIIQAELRHARSDHVMILSLLSKITINNHLQKQVDDYYDDSEVSSEDETHTSPGAGVSIREA